MEVSSLFSAKALAQVDGDLAERALGQLGLDREVITTPANRVPVEQHHALFEALAQTEQPDISFHMRTSGSMRLEDFGLLGLTMRSAPTLRRSIERLDRYARLFNPYSVFAFAEHGTDGWWTNTRTVATEGGRLSNEAALGTLLTLWRDANGSDLTPARVQFMHQPVGSIEPLRAHFRCPITYGAPFDAIVLRGEDLDRQNRVGDQHIWDFLRANLEQSLGVTEEDGVDREVVICVANALSDGVPRLQDVARDLGIGSRTLQRRLAERGHSYQSLVDEARREVALRLVAEGRQSLVEVAFLTGFAEQSSFTRAFKRWSGKTPRAFREEAPRAPAIASAQALHRNGTLRA
ncbi:AraC family transcriptional regulator [Croceicoccus gelatinilyticus]|uniref:AraC family transcriptional regulator n=1 Tax=Croceicoccus gelatinilyticus TaxID=2835536 RepID=UPI001BD0398C|nr:AraC family transcriptional regulator [Croceicoccus gelatinilyticus]MBS7670650.1 AraC family transcriptional regulator [Croceicoccus gelatinilyticus]